jgi:hypothetical protein
MQKRIKYSFIQLVLSTMSFNVLRKLLISHCQLDLPVLCQVFSQASQDVRSKNERAKALAVAARKNFPMIS